MTFHRSLIKLSEEHVSDARRNQHYTHAKSRFVRYKLNKWLLPVSLVFAITCVIISFRFDANRRKNGPCVDCVRQREIAEEIYFGKKPQPQIGHRM